MGRGQKPWFISGGIHIREVSTGNTLAMAWIEMKVSAINSFVNFY